MYGAGAVERVGGRSDETRGKYPAFAGQPSMGGECSSQCAALPKSAFQNSILVREGGRGDEGGNWCVSVSGVGYAMIPSCTIGLACWGYCIHDFSRSDFTDLAAAAGGPRSRLDV